MQLYIKNHINLSFQNSAEITEFYRSLEVDYPKFFKMDGLSKLGFVASEVILAGDSRLRGNDSAGREDVAVIFFNRSSSLEIDTQYQATIQQNDNYFPSPALFVYTLPNVAAGEIAIRNKFLGETAFYITENFDPQQIFQTTQNTFKHNDLTFALVAWLENFGNIFEVKMFLVTKDVQDLGFTPENLLM
ncbi:MAG: hypothetical protein LBN95_11775 [Prevotellaceae bacterium]|jgi:hypothetical protein|nr:hypothetical protein [Prevotellaceae bacterium]